MRSNSREAVAERRAGRRQRLERELARMLELLRAWPGVQRVILFGSLASGAPRAHSDLDLAIIPSTTKPFLARLDEFYLRLLPRVATDILVYTPEELDTLVRTRPFVAAIQNKGKVLYESVAA